jgi:hypothetical protein
MKNYLPLTACLKSILVTGTLVFLPVFLFSQVIPQWVKTYNGPANAYDFAIAVVTDHAGNVYVTGKSEMNYLTIKYNEAGVQQWVQVYDGPTHQTDEAAALVVDMSGNVFVTGRSEGSETGFDMATIKYNKNGQLQWVQRYNGTGNNLDFGTDLKLDKQGNLYVTGGSYGVAQNADYVTIRYNPSGMQQWVQRYNGPGNGTDIPAALYVDSQSNIYITGVSDADFVTIRYNSSGTQQWVQRFDRLGGDAATAITGYGDEVYVTGWSFNPQGTGSDYCTIHYTTQGTRQWVRIYDGPGHDIDQASAIAADASGNVYITGASFGTNSNFDYATIKYDAAGTGQWVRRYDGPAHATDNAADLALDSFGNIYVTGFSVAGGTSAVFSDYLTIKYSTSGNQEWISRYNGTGNNSDQATSISVDQVGNVVVTGGSINALNYDYLTIKYQTPFACGPDHGKVFVCHQGKPICISSAAVAAHLQHGDQPGNCSEEMKALSSVRPELGSETVPELFSYPNPAFSGTTVVYDLPFECRVTIKVYDNTGNKKAVLVDAVRKAGSYQVYYNTRGLGKGLFNLHMSVQSEKKTFQLTKKLAVLK